MAILTSASYLFYAYINLNYVWLLLLTTSISYWYGKKIIESKRYKHRYLYGGLIFLVGVLALFKYYNFAAVNLRVLGIQVPFIEYILPAGISFYIFHAISYMADAYQNKFKKPPLFWDYVLYLSFFPKLIAGPITKAHEFLPQVMNRVRLSRQIVWQASILIFFGLFKKLVFANNLAPFVDKMFASYQSTGGVELLLAAYAYAVQIYTDFSGYSDIALGVALLFGYRLPNNFNYPYLAHSPSDFWRRWHITLSAWFREYVYFPLGGNRRGELRTYFNIFLVMLLTGIWHGASWNFVLWGLYWAMLSVIYKLFKLSGRGIWSVLLMLQLTVAGWVMFRAPNLTAIRVIFTKILTLSGWEHAGRILDTNKLAIGLVLVFGLYNLARIKWEVRERILTSYYNPLVMTVIFLGLLTMLAVYPAGSTQFIYFKF